MRKFLLILIILIFAVSSHAQENDLNFLGLQFPELKTDINKWILDDDTVFRASYPANFEVLLYLNKKGTVDSISYNDKIKPDFVRGVIQSLNALKFEPSKFENKKTSLILPINLTFSASGAKKIARITLPYQDSGEIVNRDMVEKTLRLNGFVLPGINMWPTYYFKINPDTMLKIYNYGVYEISIDANGDMTDFVELATNNEKLSELFTITGRFAEFRPAEYDGQKFDSKIYVIARFFENIQYPTDPWPPQDHERQNYPFDYLRIESRLWLDSLLAPAYPINLSGNFGSEQLLLTKDSVQTIVYINPEGQIDLAIYNENLNPETKQNLNNILKQVKFMPAMNSDGEAVEFRGNLLITKGISRKIRINATWLSSESYGGGDVR